MKKIKSISFGYLPLPAHYAFFTERLMPLLANAGAAVKLAIAVLLALLNEWLVKEKTLIEWQRRSAYTALITEADHVLDTALAALSAQIGAAIYSTSADVQASASRLRMMIKQYGNVARAPYESEIGSVKAILGHLTGDMAADVQLINLGTFITALQAAYDDFNVKFNARDKERIQKPDFTFREVRHGIEGAYHQLTALLEANAIVGTSPEFEALIAELNPIIERINAQYRSGSSAAAAPAATTNEK